MITTGGGWQDNVGGLAPGIKEGSSTRGLPLQVMSTPVEMPKGFVETFEKHLVLVFSGKTRLARNMLQVFLFSFFFLSLSCISFDESNVFSYSQIKGP